MNETLANTLMVIMVSGSLFIAIVSYIPRFPKMLAPTWSTHFLSTVIVVIASKLMTLYAVIAWVLTSAEETQHTFFIWGYFLCMFFGIFVYFNFGASERERANTVRILESTPLAVLVSLGILLFYSYTTISSYSYWLEQMDKVIFLEIAIISSVDFFFFFVLWLRYWLTRSKVTAEAHAFQHGQF